MYEWFSYVKYFLRFINQNKGMIQWQTERQYGPKKILVLVVFSISQKSFI